MAADRPIGEILSPIRPTALTPAAERAAVNAAGPTVEAAVNVATACAIPASVTVPAATGWPRRKSAAGYESGPEING